VDLNKEIEVAIQSYLESDKLKEHIQTKAEKMVNDLVDDTFGYFGGVKKSVEEAMKDEIKINTKELGLGGFNKFISEIVKDKLDNAIKNEAQEKICAEIDKIISPMDKEISIEELKKVLFDDAGTYGLDVCGEPSLDDLDAMGIYEDEIFTFIIERPSDPERYTWATIYMDKIANTSQYSCEFQITVHENFSTFKINERDLKAKDKVFGYKSGVEDFMYAMFLNESRVNHADTIAHSY